MNSKLLSEDYACNLVCEIIELTGKRMQLRQESLDLRKAGFGGKADICDEIGQTVSASLKIKRDTLSTMERNMDMKYEYSIHGDWGILRRKVKGKGWINIASSPEEFKKRSEDFVSDFILGAYDSTDTT